MKSLLDHSSLMPFPGSLLMAATDKTSEGNDGGLQEVSVRGWWGYGKEGERKRDER
jgi:hypothetical protein